MRAFAVLFTFFVAGLSACGPREDYGRRAAVAHPAPRDTRPLARYWLFAAPLDTSAIAADLDWLRDHGFGGVELAFVYPHGRMAVPRDSTPVDRPAWLSPEWRRAVDFTQRYAAAQGLRCDLTGGSLWPFGDPEVPWAEATQRFSSATGGTDTAWRQEITAHWAWPTAGLVVDHLTPAYYLDYFQRTLDSYPAPLSPAGAQSLFVDSWEVETRGLWADDFGAAFAKTYDYRIEPHMDSLYAPGRERQRYDYHALLSDRVLRFYRDFDSVANARGYSSRAQVSGAPVDLLDAYRVVDVPESEAMLFEPTFSRIPASAAAIAGRNVVSAEAFTCLYGWPRNHLREEQVADLKLVADHLFANGVNQIVWHGKPYQPLGSRDSNQFYATVHLGDSSALAPHLRAFNAYLTEVSRQLRRGRPYYQVAQYLPTEDAWVAGELPLEEQFVWAWGAYEMRDVVPRAVLGNASPLWVNATALLEAELDGETLTLGEQRVRGLLIDAAYVPASLAPKLVALQAAGFPVVVTRASRLLGLDDASGPPLDASPPEQLPEARPLFAGHPHGPGPAYAAREIGDTLLLFFAPTPTRPIVFPLYYGHAAGAVVELDTEVNWRGHAIPLDTTGAPGQALLFEIADGRARAVDIGYVPPPPHTVSDTLPQNRPWRPKATDAD